MTQTRDDIEATEAVQGDTAVLLVRSAWDAAAWAAVRAEIVERLAAGERSPVLARHMTALGIDDVLLALAEGA